MVTEKFSVKRTVILLVISEVANHYANYLRRYQMLRWLAVKPLGVLETFSLSTLPWMKELMARTGTPIVNGAFISE